MKTLYQATATADAGREGNVKSSDGVLDLEVKLPTELGGKGGAYTNPEQLFAAGYSACFGGALNLVALQNKIKLKDSKVTAVVGIGQTDEGGFGLEVTMKAEMPGIEKEVAKDLLEKAHQICPYSVATRGNIEVTLELL